MTKAITFLGLVTILTALCTVASAQGRDSGPHVTFDDASMPQGIGACLVDRIVCGEQSCEVFLEPGCPMTLDQCLNGEPHFYANDDDEEGTEVLGCAVDARSVDVDKDGV